VGGNVIKIIVILLLQSGCHILSIVMCSALENPNHKDGDFSSGKDTLRVGFPSVNQSTQQRRGCRRVLRGIEKAQRGTRIQFPIATSV